MKNKVKKLDTIVELHNKKKNAYHLWWIPKTKYKHETNTGPKKDTILTPPSIHKIQHNFENKLTK